MSRRKYEKVGKTILDVFFVSLFLLPAFVFANGDDAYPHEDGALHTHDGAAAKVADEMSVREGPVVNLNISPVPVEVGTTTRLDFFVNLKPGNTPVPFYELDVEHTKLMHVIGVRSDLSGFRHIHPEPDSENPALFSLEHIFDFDEKGVYTFWSEISLSGAHYTFRHPAFIAGYGSIPSIPSPPTPPIPEGGVSFGRNVVIGNYQVGLEIAGTPIKGRNTDFTFDVHTVVGDGVALEEYLGETMHLVAIREDLKQFVHAHPIDAHEHSAMLPLVREAHAHGATGDAIGYEPVNFHVQFPTAGRYKLFAQFRPQGSDLPAEETITAEFWVEVDDQTVSLAAQWWILLTGSLVLMAGLSFGVYKFIHRQNV